MASGLTGLVVLLRQILSQGVILLTGSQFSAISALMLMEPNSSDRTVFDCREAWYPVFYERDIDKTRPHAFTLLGTPLVLWWSGQWRAFADRCPHRLASLSEGRINEAGQLECPYHGWAFGGSGQCEQIPQQLPGAKAETSQRACATVYATAVRQGMVFVYAGLKTQADLTPLPLVPALEEDTDAWVCIDTFRDLPYDAFTLLENVLDSSHLPFTHHRSVGNRANAGPVELAVIHADRLGFHGFWQEGPRKGKLGSQDTYFVAPGLMWHDLTSQQFGRTLTVVYATPIEKGKCRLFARFPFKFPTPLPGIIFKLTPRWYSHWGQNAILEDDQVFLHHQERYLELAHGKSFQQVFYLPTKADLFVATFRQWIEEYQVDPFPGILLSPRQPQELLLDRYHSHTKHCQSCRGALANFERLQQVLVCIVGLTIVLSYFIATKLPLVVIGLVSAVTWERLNKLKQQFYFGRKIPPRNLPS